MAISIAQILGETLGGYWAYDFNNTWVCDDGQRKVIRHRRRDSKTLPEYWLYGDGVPRRAELYVSPGYTQKLPFNHPIAA